MNDFGKQTKSVLNQKAGLQKTMRNVKKVDAIYKFYKFINFGDGFCTLCRREIHNNPKPCKSISGNLSR